MPRSDLKSDSRISRNRDFRVAGPGVVRGKFGAPGAPIFGVLVILDRLESGFYPYLLGFWNFEFRVFNRTRKREFPGF